MNLRRCICFILIACTSCHKETPEEKKARRSFTRIGYSQLNLFIFSVRQTDSSNAFIRQDTVGLFCSAELSDAINKMTKTQWQFLTTDKSGSYILDSQKFSSYYEGTICNDSILFLHPARSCFKVLQHCPYPYFYNNAKDTWNWKFDVGAHWGVDSIYPIKEVTTYDINYKLHDTVVKINSGVGKLPCYIVTAESTSEFGNSHTAYYLNEDYGMVYVNVQPVNKQRFEFRLLSKIGKRDSIKKINGYFMWELEHPPYPEWMRF